MGSLPEGTLCAYCRIRTASYVPDHCIGPTCLSGPGNCYDRAAVVGWQVITDGYRKMRGAAWGKLLALRYELPVPDNVQLRIYEYLWET